MVFINRAKMNCSPGCNLRYFQNINIMCFRNCLIVIRACTIQYVLMPRRNTSFYHSDVADDDVRLFLATQPTTRTTLDHLLSTSSTTSTHSLPQCHKQQPVKSPTKPNISPSKPPTQPTTKSIKMTLRTPPTQSNHHIPSPTSKSSQS